MGVVTGLLARKLRRGTNGWLGMDDGCRWAARGAWWFLEQRRGQLARSQPSQDCLDLPALLLRFSSRQDAAVIRQRVIYFIAQDESIWLLIVYAKNKFDDLPPEFLAQLRREVENG